VRSPSSDQPNGAHAPDAVQRPRLELHTISLDGQAVVAIAGEVDPSTTEQFASGIEAAFSQAPRVVLDLRDVTFMDSTGLRVLIQAQQHHDHGREALVLRSPGAFLHRLLTITGVDQLFTIEADPIQADSATE